MSKSIPVALLGTGYIATYHLAILRNLPGVEVVGACDPSQARLDAFCNAERIPHRATSLAALLDLCRPRVVHVLTPPAHHYNIAREALEAGLHVLVEKPMALSSEECRQLLQIARAQNVGLGVNHNLVYLPLFQKLLKDLAGHRIGRIEHVESINHLPLAQLDAGAHDHWMFRAAVNILFEQAPHPLSLICALLGAARHVSATAGGERRLRDGRPFHSTWQLELECARGTAHVYLSWGRSFPEQTLTVLGQDGTLFLDLLNNVHRVDRLTKYLEPVDRCLRLWRSAWQTARSGWLGLWNYGLSTVRLRGRTDPYYLSMQNSIANFYQELQSSQHESASARNGLEVIDAIEQAASSISFPPGVPRSASAPASSPELARASEVLVLGGTGFIGRKVVRMLLKTGYPVRLLARKPAMVPDFGANNSPVLFAGDIENAGDVERAVQGCRFVIHLASGAPATWAEYEHLFVEGTRNVAQACLRARVKRLLFASTIAALYLGDPDETITEETPADPHWTERTEYARAKILCERLLLEMHLTHGLPVTIIRPGVVVGAGGMVEHLGVGYWPNATHCISWGPKVDRPLPFVLADDVASALVSSLSAEKINGKTLNLVGDVRLTASEYVNLVGQFSERETRLHPQSFVHWQAVDIAKWFIKLCARKPENPFPSYRDLVSRSLASPFDCTRTKELLDWHPVKDRSQFIECGIREAITARQPG